MLLQRYFNEIESLEFQIQFSVVGGLKILQMAMERHPTLVGLRSAIIDNAGLEEDLFGRILFLLRKVDAEAQLSYDESIAAYLFCLSKEKPFTAYRASWSILDHGGLWWSGQLAHFVKHYNSQIIESIDASTVKQIPARSYRTTLKTLNTKRDSSYHISKVTWYWNLYSVV